MEIKIDLPLTAEKVAMIHAGDTVKLTGVIYTARDAAHKRLVAMLDAGEQLPVELKDQTVSVEYPGKLYSFQDERTFTGKVKKIKEFCYKNMYNV